MNVACRCTARGDVQQLLCGTAQGIRQVSTAHVTGKGHGAILVCVYCIKDVTYPSDFGPLLGLVRVVVTRGPTGAQNATRFVDESTLRLSYVHSKVHVLL